MYLFLYEASSSADRIVILYLILEEASDRGEVSILYNTRRGIFQRRGVITTVSHSRRGAPREDRGRTYPPIGYHGIPRGE